MACCSLQIFLVNVISRGAAWLFCRQSFLQTIFFADKLECSRATKLGAGHPALWPVRDAGDVGAVQVEAGVRGNRV